MYVSMCVCVYVCMCAHVYACMCVCVYGATAIYSLEKIVMCCSVLHMYE